jgi:hypothetical protein
MSKISVLPPNFRVLYKSGDGESFVEKIDEIINGKVNHKVDLDCYETLYEKLETDYHHIIFAHDHDNNTGFGMFKVIDGIVSEQHYALEED